MHTRPINIKDRACTMKIPWPSQSAAQEHLIAGKKKQKYNNEHHVYHCNFCGGYHIGQKGKLWRKWKNQNIKY